MEHVVTHICDDVRFETGNKVSLIGLYDLNLIVRQVPARIPQLALFQRWAGVSGARKIKIEVRGSASAGVHTFQADYLGDRDRVQIALRFSPIELIGAGELEFATYWDGQPVPTYTHRVGVEVTSSGND